MKSEELANIEYKLLCMAVTEAVRHAGNGDVGAGVRCLDAGMRRAEELAETGAGWAWGLAQSYQAALRGYTQLCGTDPTGGVMLGGTFRPRQVVYTPN